MHWQLKCKIFQIYSFLLLSLRKIKHFVQKFNELLECKFSKTYLRSKKAKNNRYNVHMSAFAHKNAHNFLIHSISLRAGRFVYTIHFILLSKDSSRSESIWLVIYTIYGLLWCRTLEFCALKMYIISIFKALQTIKHDFLFEMAWDHRNKRRQKKYIRI